MNGSAPPAFETSLVAVANHFDELSHDRPGQRALSAEQALAVVESEDALHSAEAVKALAASLHDTPANVRPPGFAGGLTIREVEVLVLTAEGLSRRQIANKLVLSESTVRSQLEHIFAKLGVSTKVGAVLFAVENRLVP